MKIISIGTDRFYHPENEDQIRDLILYAVENSLKVRVRGSAHSIRDAIYTGNRNTDNGIDIMLDRMNNVSINRERKQVTAQAGCHLGMDPFDPAESSNMKDSLFYQLDQAGLAIPDMGGIIHQTVGGFLSTGSAGGSVQYSFGDQLIALRIIDGNGETHILNREGSDGIFFAAGVSMGLLGIITEATFQCVDSFHIIGEETTTTVDHCSIDLFGSGGHAKPGLEDFLRKTEYSRLMWWPQKKVDRIIIWKARQMHAEDYSSGKTISGNGSGPGAPDRFIPKPYHEFPHLYNSGLHTDAAGGLFYSVVGNWHQGLKRFRVSLALKTVLSLVGWLYPRQILPLVLREFVPLDEEKKPNGPQKFWDSWWHGLSFDNRVGDTLMPTESTEIWIPLSNAAYVMTKLRELYTLKGYEATGSYSCEIYAAKRSDFWLSPSYNGEYIRINLQWYGYHTNGPVRSYYPQFWNLLMQDEKLHCRFHWGKYLPLNPVYLRKQYPKWDDFFELRKKLDPNRIFLTDYWSKYLNV
jgi:hypothetical protein